MLSESTTGLGVRSGSLLNPDLEALRKRFSGGAPCSPAIHNYGRGLPNGKGHTAAAFCFRGPHVVADRQSPQRPPGWCRPAAPQQRSYLLRDPQLTGRTAGPHKQPSNHIVHRTVIPLCRNSGHTEFGRHRVRRQRIRGPRTHTVGDSCKEVTGPAETRTRQRHCGDGQHAKSEAAGAGAAAVAVLPIWSHRM
jgi:hypothetical protein